MSLPPGLSHSLGLCCCLAPIPAVDKVQFHPQDQRKVFVGLSDGTCQVVHYPAGDHSQVRAPIDVSYGQAQAILQSYGGATIHGVTSPTQQAVWMFTVAVQYCLWVLILVDDCTLLYRTPAALTFLSRAARIQCRKQQRVPECVHRLWRGVRWLEYGVRPLHH